MVLKIEHVFIRAQRKKNICTQWSQRSQIKTRRRHVHVWNLEAKENDSLHAILIQCFPFSHDKEQSPKLMRPRMFGQPGSPPSVISRMAFSCPLNSRPKHLLDFSWLLSCAPPSPGRWGLPPSSPKNPNSHFGSAWQILLVIYPAVSSPFWQNPNLVQKSTAVSPMALGFCRVGPISRHRGQIPVNPSLSWWSQPPCRWPVQAQACDTLANVLWGVVCWGVSWKRFLPSQKSKTQKTRKRQSLLALGGVVSACNAWHCCPRSSNSGGTAGGPPGRWPGAGWLLALLGSCTELLVSVT